MGVKSYCWDCMQTIEKVDFSSMNTQRMTDLDWIKVKQLPEGEGNGEKIEK